MFACFNRIRAAILPAFFAVIVTAAAVAEQPGSSTIAKANMCVGCHEIPNYRSVFPEVFPVPKIIGQKAEYIQYALEAYRSGGRTHPSMSSVAAQLSDSDISALAEYYEQLAR